MGLDPERLAAWNARQAELKAELNEKDRKPRADEQKKGGKR